jgi:hypothetical protein
MHSDIRARRASHRSMVLEDSRASAGEEADEVEEVGEASIVEESMRLPAAQAQSNRPVSQAG